MALRKQSRYFTYFYRPQRSWAKVIFLHLSVILLTGGCLVGGVSPVWEGCLVRGGVLSRGVSNFSGGLQFFGGSPNFFFHIFFLFFSNFFFQKFLLGCTKPPPPETVNAWPVRILLECILVYSAFIFRVPCVNACFCVCFDLM